MKVYSPFPGIIIISILYLASCTSPKQISSSIENSGYCEPAIHYSDNFQYLEAGNFELLIKDDSLLTNLYSRHDLLIANATGVLPLLQKLITHSQKSDFEARLVYSELYIKIHNRLLHASTEISSLVAELDCEGERAEQLANYLDQQDQSRIRNLTLLSIVAGAATTIVAAVVKSDRSENIISIGGGVLSAGLGGAAAFSSNKSVKYLHKRNLLTDIWEESEKCSNYSQFVWYVLNEKSFSNSGQNSVRYNIRQRWKEYVLKEKTEEQIELFFGTGGNYQSDDLHARSNMLNQLQASVLSINQDLKSLIINLPK